MAEIGNQVWVPFNVIILVKKIPEWVQVGVVRPGKFSAIIKAKAVGFP
jgi:hypothetical protein